MVTECKRLVALSSIPIMSTAAKSATLPLQTFNGLGIGLTPMNSPFKNSLKCDKKVEVRWLETESDLYLRQWQRRHRQLEGIDDTSWGKNENSLDHHEDWYLTARRILDLDVNYMNSKDFNKFNPENYNDSLNFFFNRVEPKFLLDIDNELEDDFCEFDSDMMQFETIPIDPNMEMNQELITLLKSNNLIIKNGKLEYYSKKTKNTEKEKAEKPPKKTPKLQPAMEATNVINDESASIASSDTSPSKNSSKSPRKSTSKQRTRPPSGRRQMYTCEYPGCSYQSDRNFNFLRHKRTHGKQKCDEIKKAPNGISMPMTSELIYPTAKMPNLNEPTPPFVGLEMGSINNEVTHLNSQSPLLHNELSLNLPQCNSINSSVNRDQAFSLTNDYLDRQNILLKDIHTMENNSLDHVLADNPFTNLAIEQPFLS